jgi:hypothetical protein
MFEVGSVFIATLGVELIGVVVSTGSFTTGGVVIWPGVAEETSSSAWVRLVVPVTGVVRHAASARMASGV